MNAGSCAVQVCSRPRRRMTKTVRRGRNSLFRPLLTVFVILLLRGLEHTCSAHEPVFILRARVAPRRPPEWAGLLPFTIIGVGRFLSRRRSRYLSGNAGVEFSPVFLGQRELGIVVVFPLVVHVKAKKYRPSLFWLDRRPARRCIPCPKIYRSNPCCCLHHSRGWGEVSGTTGGKRNERDKVGEQGGMKRSTEIQFQHMDTKTTSVYVCFFEATG